MKPKKFRVAVAGATVDGRTIEPQWLREAAETFNPSTYGVRVNVEHIRGVSGDKPFGMVGDVVALSVQEDTLQIGGKAEKRTCLYAEIQPNERAKDLNKADQKVYTSIELYPDFAKSGKYGLTGIAVTDTPASIGTERLQFSKVFGVVPTEPHEHAEFRFDEETPTTAQTEAASAFSEMKKFFAGLAGLATPAPAPVITAPPAPVAAPDQFAAVLTGLQTLSTAVEASSKATNEQVTKLAADLEALKVVVNTTPNQTYTPRPAATGGDGRILAAC